MKKISIFAWFGFPLPMEERFRLMKSIGFTHTSLWWGDEYIDLDGPKEEHPGLAGRHGLALENVHLRYSDANELWLEGLAADELMRYYEKSIRECAEHMIPTAVLHLTTGHNPPDRSDLGVDRIKRLVALAEDIAVNIALENLRKPEYLDYVFQRIHSPRLGFCYDSGHDFVYATKNAGLLEKYGDRLMTLHLHDNDGVNDRHMIPGEGEINWTLINSLLRKYHFHGPVALEVTNEFSEYKDRESPEEFLKRAFDAAMTMFPE